MITSNDYDLFHNNINKKIKVLEVINSLKIGGAELLLRNFVIEARKNIQYTVDVCTLYADNDANNIEEIKKKNVRIWSLDLKNKYSLSSVGRIKKIIERENHDIVHVHLFPASAIVALSSLFLPKHIGYVLTEHSTFNRRRSAQIFKIFDSFIYRRYAKIICISKQVQNSLIKWVPKIKEKIEIIPNGIPMNSKSNDSPLMKKYDALFVGRLVQQKGINFLLEAVSILQKKYKKIIRAAIVGDGPLKKELIKMCEELKIEDFVEFLGFQRDVDQIMRSSRVLVLPSRCEGFGLVLLEAMKNKLPIIATNVGGIPEIITNEYEGILVPKENPEMLADSINRVLENSELRDQLIQNAYKKVQGYYSIEKYAHNMFNIYSKMIRDNL
jgi:glycosyltransferase involved in cell wall biosynthesis